MKIQLILPFLACVMLSTALPVWDVAQAAPLVCYSLKVAYTSGDPITVRDSANGGAKMGTVSEGDEYKVIGYEPNGKTITDNASPIKESAVWLQIKFVDDLEIKTGWLSMVYAKCQDKKIDVEKPKEDTSGGANGRLVSRDGEWMLPVKTTTLSSSEEDHLNRGSVNAWDLNENLNANVYPAKAGTVVYAGCDNAGGYGCWVYLQHAGGYTTVYAHMVTGSIKVSQGQSVTQSTILGNVGWTGTTSFGPHCHFELRKGKQLRISEIFDRTKMTYCKLCNGKK